MKSFQLFVIIAVSAAVLAGCGGAQTGPFAPGPMPKDGAFDGVYQSDFGRLELTVNGDFVFGLYEGERHFGRIEGTIEGALLHFKWTQWDERLGGKYRESTGRGIFRYIVDEEKAGDKIKYVHRLEGEWGYGELSAGNRWNAYRLSDRAKKRLTRRSPGQTAPGDADERENGSGFVDTK